MTDAIIDLRYLAESQPSLCIPRVFNNIDESRIRHVFDEIELGQIHHIDIIERKNEKGESFKRIYIHFEKWYWNEDAQSARRKLISGKEIKIVYDNPWFWKVSANKSNPQTEIRREPEHRNYPSKVHIEFDDEPRRQDNRQEPRQDNRRQYNRIQEPRQDNRRQEPIQDNRILQDNRRQDNRRQDNRRQDNRRQEQINFTPSSPSNSPPRQRNHLDTPRIVPQYSTSINKRTLLVKKPIVKVEENPIVKIEDNKQIIFEIEEDEAIEECEVVIVIEDVIIPEMSEENKKLCDEMYGDLVDI
jgi:hypothetical protein